MQQFLEFFKQKKNLVNLIFLAILVISLPFGIDLARKQQILRSRANIVPIAFLQNQCISQRNGIAVATCADMSLQLTSPIGPPGSETSTGGVCDPDEKDDEVIKTTWEKTEVKECKKGEAKATYSCKNKSKSLKISCSESSTATTHTCDPKENNEATIKETWFKGEEKGSCKKGKIKVEYICRYDEDGKSKQERQEIEESCTETSRINFIPEVFAGHFQQTKYFCEGTRRVLEDKGADGTYQHFFDKDCATEGKVCQDGECVTGNQSPNPPSGTCSIGNQSPSIPTACRECILKKDSDLISSIKQQDANKFNSCSDTQLLNYFCNGGVKGAEGCPKERLELCPKECDGWKPNASSDLCNKFQTPTITKSCKECILEEDEDLLPSIVQQNPNGFKACSVTQVFSYFCNGGVKGANGCSRQRLDLCKDECSTFKPTATPRSSSSSDSDDDSNDDDDDGDNNNGGKDKNPKPSASAGTRIGVTTSFKIAESPTELANAASQPYTQDGQAVGFVFSSITPGTKTIFVEFTGFTDSKKKTPTTKVEQVSIEMVAPNPTISTAKCSLSSFGEGITVDLSGQNFGNDGGSLSVKEAGQNILGDVTEWKDTQVSATVNLPDDTDAEGRVINFIVTRKDNVTVEGSCAVGQFSALALGAKLFCRAPSSNIQEGVEIMIAEDTPKSEVREEIVSIDKSGLVRGLETKFVEGKTYQVSVKSPRSLRRNSRPFVATNGTIQLVFQGNEGNDINKNKLPIGDIFPLDGGDGAINSQDGRELFLEWSGATPRTGISQKLGDFNLDGKVNSIDWACMRYDFNESEDPPLQPLLRSAASPSPSPAPTPEPSSSPIPSPSPQITGTPVAIQNFLFNPTPLTIKKGTTVIWTNRDASPHSVISDSSLNFSGEILGQDSSHNFTFNQTGTFDYHCGLHPEMKGKIIVTD